MWLLHERICTNAFRLGLSAASKLKLLFLFHVFYMLSCEWSISFCFYILHFFQRDHFCKLPPSTWQRTSPLENWRRPLPLSAWSAAPSPANNDDSKFPFRVAHTVLHCFRIMVMLRFLSCAPVFLASCCSPSRLAAAASTLSGMAHSELPLLPQGMLLFCGVVA
jgi:hypothetical protein